MTSEEFIDRYSGCPYDDGEIIELACEVDGELGEKANAAYEAVRTFWELLNGTDFERG